LLLFAGPLALCGSVAAQGCPAFSPLALSCEDGVSYRRMKKAG
jgi:hypothetical protein